jgi:hypothetical protein
MSGEDSSGLEVVVNDVDVPEKEECGECDPKSCPNALGCRAGFQSDACGCCSVCAASEGEKCDIDSAAYRYGSCGDNLECKLREDLESGQSEATCQCTDEKLVCGTDGKTYENICRLRGEANIQRAETNSKSENGTQQDEQTILTVDFWGPCEERPRITSKPEDSRVVQGGNVALACEAKGWPVPVITWETVRADGSQFILPSDHTTIAVQQRGGPERLMVSGWVQLMDVQPGDGGTYTCIAKNKLGEASVSSQVGVFKEDSKEESERSVSDNNV